MVEYSVRCGKEGGCGWMVAEGRDRVLIDGAHTNEMVLPGRLGHGRRMGMSGGVMASSSDGSSGQWDEARIDPVP